MASREARSGDRTLEACVDMVLSTVGPRLVVGTPLGLGKPMELLNAFYRRARADPDLELVLITGLTLLPPRPRGELERRLLDPILERVFGGCPLPAWEEARRADRLPPNVRVHEFFLQPGSLLDSKCAQQDYVASNYTHVARDAIDRGVNVYVQMVARRVRDGRTELSLSSNPDLALDVVPELRRHARATGVPRVSVADVHERLPFLGGDAQVEPSFFDHVLDRGADTRLFGTPDEPVSTTDWMIALHVSALIRDGGTLQLGIGSLSDGVCHMLRLRHEQNAAWRELLDAAGVRDHSGELIARLGGLDPFEEGLYAATEMLVDGYLELYRAGILRRRVWPSPTLQRLANAGALGERPHCKVLEALCASREIGSPLRPSDLERLVDLGVLHPGIRLEGDFLVLPDGTRAPADLREEETLRALETTGLGTAYRGGRIAHAAFFLGPEAFYRELADLPEEERELFETTRVGRVNSLFGDEELRRLQRRHARYVNTTLSVSLLGAASSDALEDGRVISGVGGQYNLVAMAHELKDARSILMLRSTRARGGRVTSNVVFSYGNTTIPRHLRDLVVTEYGIADLRGRTDAECCAAMIRIADARFQQTLAARARRAGKLPPGWTVPAAARRNTPERLHDLVTPRRRAGLLPRFPFGTDLDEREAVLANSLRATRDRWRAGRPRLPSPAELARILRPPDAARPYLERMGLDAPKTLRERLLRWVLLYSLVTERCLERPVADRGRD